MKETPLLFNAPMVRAILDGSKTQTRRIVKPQPAYETTSQDVKWFRWRGQGLTDPIGIQKVLPLNCPYGQLGDRLWVRETFVHIDDEGGKLDGMGSQTYYAASGDYEGNTQWLRKRGLKWTPSIHMPRWASRITLEIVSVRVERLQDISEDDALAEGIEELDVVIGANCNGGFHSEEHGARYYFDGCDDEGFESAYDAYCALWESINGPGSWNANPWVWCVSFRRIAA